MWQRVVQSEVDAARGWRPEGWGEGQKWQWNAAAGAAYDASKVKAQHMGQVFRDGALTTFAAQRGHMDAIWHRYDKPAALTKLKNMLYTTRGEGGAPQATYHEAVHTRSRARLNDLHASVQRSGVGELSKAENQALRYILVSGDSLVHNADVAAHVASMKLDRVAPERLAKVRVLATDLRQLMNKEFYYNRAAGIDVGYRSQWLPAAQSGLSGVRRRHGRFRAPGHESLRPAAP